MRKLWLALPLLLPGCAQYTMICGDNNRTDQAQTTSLSATVPVSALPGLGAATSPPAGAKPPQAAPPSFSCAR